MRARLRFDGLSLARAACALGLLWSSCAGADAFDPLPALDLHPLTRIHGLPAYHGARLLGPGRGQVRVALQAASHFLMQRSARELLALDGETHWTSVTLRYAGAGAEWGIEIPYVAHSGGFLDSLVENWHRAFGLPRSGRDQAPRGRLDFLYRRDGETRFALERASRGLGDVRLLAAWPLARERSRALALRASLKLPTGEAHELRGSGAADLALWLAAGCGECAAAWGWHASAGVLVLGRGELLPELQRPLAAFGAAGVGWRAAPALVLKAGLRGHTPLYRDSGLRALDRTALRLILGASWRLARRTTLDLAVTEDARIETAPDVGFLLSLGVGF